MNIDEQYIISEISKTSGVSADKIKLVPAPDHKRVHVFVLANIDEDTILNQQLHDYARDHQFRFFTFASATIDVVRREYAR